MQSIAIKWKFILISILALGLWATDYGLIYGQDDHLTVKGVTKVDSLTFSGNRTAFPVAPLEGEIFYNTQPSEKTPKYYNGTAWQNIGAGGGPKAVATKIVAASDSSNKAYAHYASDGTNDQQEINKAINSLPASGGAVYLLEGTYNISTTLLEGETINGIVPHNNTAIIGAGRGTILKIASGASSANVINASNVNRILISQLTITDANTSGTSNRGINFSNVTDSKIEKIWLEGIRGSGIYFSSSSNNSVCGNNAQSNASSGIYFSSSSNNTVSGNNAQSNASSGIYFSSSSNNTVCGNNAQSNASSGIYFSSSSNNTVSSNNVKNNSQEGIYLDSSSNNNVVSGNNTQENILRGIRFASSSSNIVSSNNVKNNSQEGIYLASSSNNIISGNVIDDNGGSGGYEGIELYSDSDTNIISSNRIYDSAGSGYGINISTDTCGRNYLAANFIDGSYAQVIRDLGTSTNYTDKTKITLEPKQVDITTTPYQLNVSATPQGYVALNPTTTNTTLTLANGKATGELLILENISANYTVRINDSGNVALGLTRTLSRYDILRLIWDGERWLEIKYVDN